MSVSRQRKQMRIQMSLVFVRLLRLLGISFDVDVTEAVRSPSVGPNKDHDNNSGEKKAAASFKASSPTSSGVDHAQVDAGTTTSPFGSYDEEDDKKFANGREAAPALEDLWMPAGFSTTRRQYSTNSASTGATSFTESAAPVAQQVVEEDVVEVLPGVVIDYEGAPAAVLRPTSTVEVEKCVGCGATSTGTTPSGAGAPKPRVAVPSAVVTTPHAVASGSQGPQQQGPPLMPRSVPQQPQGRMGAVPPAGAGMLTSPVHSLSRPPDVAGLHSTSSAPPGAASSALVVPVGGSLDAAAVASSVPTTSSSRSDGGSSTTAAGLSSVSSSTPSGLSSSASAPFVPSVASVASEDSSTSGLTLEERLAEADERIAEALEDLNRARNFEQVKKDEYEHAKTAKYARQQDAGGALGGDPSTLQALETRIEEAQAEEQRKKEEYDQAVTLELEAARQWRLANEHKEDLLRPPSLADLAKEHGDNIFSTEDADVHH
ncbi:unnamed protein product [Amoebophrya sp. A120]|nr:unnamed protein product [Amoebophrya sp. A120]|eukprot:GSA120T00009870001.1